MSEVSEVCTLDLIALLPGSTAPLFVNMKTQGLGLNKEMTAGHVKHLHINILCSHRLLPGLEVKVSYQIIFIVNRKIFSFFRG